MLDAASCLDPSNATSLDFHEGKSFNNFLHIFTNLIGSEEENLVKEQWNNLCNIDFNEYFNVCEITPEDFWKFVSQLNTDVGVQSYEVLGSIALTALGIPHANVNPERTFSDVKNVKTDKRNCINNESLDCILKARELISALGAEKEFEPPEEMIDMFFNRDYHNKKKNLIAKY